MVLGSVESNIAAAVFTVLVVGAALVVALVVLLFVSVRRTGRRLRAAVQRGIVTYGPGPAHELARLRVRLERSLHGAHAAVATATARGDTCNDLRMLCARLEAVGRELDEQLTSISQADMSPPLLKAMLPPLRERVDAAEALALQTASLAAASMTASSGSELDAISDSLEDEVHFVRTRTEVLHQLRVQ